MIPSSPQARSCHAMPSTAGSPARRAALAGVLEILTADQIAEVRTKLAGHTILPIVELRLVLGLGKIEPTTLVFST